MSLTVYQMPHSPYCIPITAALEGFGVEFEVLNVTPHTREEVITASSGNHYQVPMLDHDGQMVGESTAESIDVARYVDRVFAGGRLFPPAIEAAHLPLVERIENEFELAGFVLIDPHHIDSFEDVVSRTMMIRHKERRFGVGCVEDWRERHDELFAHFVDLMAPAETTLAEQGFLFGDTPVYADYALLGVIGNVTYKGVNALPDSLTNIARWRGALEAYRFSG